MNIFVLDLDPRDAAHYHNDRHVSKMILETSQMLASAHLMVDGHTANIPRTAYLTNSRNYLNHPCARWVRESSQNYKWTFALLHGLCDEFLNRHKHLHSYAEDRKVDELSQLPKLIVHDEITTRPQCMPIEYTCPGNAVAAYRDYYIGEKQHIATWKCGKPDWYMIKEKTHG